MEKLAGHIFYRQLFRAGVQRDAILLRWVQGCSAPLRSRVKRLAQGELMLASIRTGYYLTQKLTGLAASPLRSFWKSNKDWEG